MDSVGTDKIHVRTPSGPKSIGLLPQLRTKRRERIATAFGAYFGIWVEGDGGSGQVHLRGLLELRQEGVDDLR